MRIHESGLDRTPDTPTTSNTSTVHTPTLVPSVRDTTTTTASSVADTDTADFSCPHCPRTFTSRIGLVGHLRIHRTETGEPVPGAPTYTHQARLNCPHCPRTFRHRMSLFGHMRIHDDLRLSVSSFIQQRRQDENSVRLEFGVEVETLATPHCVLQPPEEMDDCHVLEIPRDLSLLPHILEEQCESVHERRIALLVEFGSRCYLAAELLHNSNSFWDRRREVQSFAGPRPVVGLEDWRYDL
nr:unnamed protein product [Spirometra erinaceieuropaei]